MKKVLKSLALVLTLTGISLPAAAQNEARLGEEETLSPTSYLTYTPTEDGVLSANLSNGVFTMDGETANSFLYTSIDGDGSNDHPYEGINPVSMVLGNVDGWYATEVSWEVSANTKYYLYLNDTQIVTLSFKAGEISSGGDNVIQLGVPFKAYEKVMEFTPENAGLLTIKANTYYVLDWCSPAGGGLLFTDANHQNKVDLECVDPDATPLVFTYVVTGGTTYYLYNAAREDCMFTFTLDEVPTPALTYVNPGPGAIDAEGDDGNGVLIKFSPVTCDISNAHIKYTTVTDQIIDRDLVFDERGLEGVDYSYNQDGTWKFQAVTMAYNGYNNTNKYDHAQVWEPAKIGSQIVLTIKADLGGIPVTKNDTGYDDGITITDEGVITITWTKPAENIAVVSQTWPEKIYRLSPEGDPALMATITFNMDLSTTQLPSVTYGFGQQYAGSPSGGDDPDPGAELPASNVKVDGKTLTINFSGIDFGAVRDEQPNKNYSTITIFVGNIFGADGQKFVEQTPGFQKWITYVNENAPTLGISSIESSMKEKAIYNLQGVKVSEKDARNGVFVIDGKKVMVK